MALEIGTKVKVIKLIDRCGPYQKIGHTGTIVAVETGDGYWPCGETPEDPGYIVQFPDNTRDLFWTEELKVLDKTP